MLKRFMKAISVFLSVVLIFQTFAIGVFSANEIYLDTPKAESDIEEEYTREMTVFSGNHQKSIGRAGTFSINDFSLIPKLSFDVLSVNSNIFPVDIRLNFNSPEYRFLSDVDGINSAVYGDGWLVNYGKFICEVEYSDVREIYFFDGNGSCEVFVRAENVPEEELDAYPQRQKWVSKYGYSDTAIWKIANRYMDYSLLPDYVPEQYLVVEATGETSRYDAFGRLREKKNANSNAGLYIDYMTGANAAPEAITKITDGMGNEFRFTYTDGKLTKIKAYNSENTAIIAGDGEDAQPLEVNLSYSGDKLTSFTFPDGKSISFTYDSSGNMTSVENIDKRRLEAEYASGYISKLSEKLWDSENEEYINGNVLTVTRNSDTVRTFSDNFGETQIKTFDTEGNILTITDEDGNILFGGDSDTEEETTEEETTEEETTEEETTEEETTEEEFISLCPCEECPEYECSCACESEELCACIQCKRSITTEYDEYGNATAEKVFDGTKTLISELSQYSSDGTQLISSTDSSGNIAYYTYNDAGLLKTVTSGLSSGVADYDAMGNLISFSQSVSGLSDGTVMSNSYTYENDMVKSISHNGFTYEFTYDAWGNQTKAQIGSIVLSENTYGTGENYNRLSSTTFANGQTIAYTYDEEDNITDVLYNGVSRYQYTYDEEGYLQSVTDSSSGLKTVYTDNGTEIRKNADNSLLFSSVCDENGNEVYNVAGNIITYSYDGEYNSVTGIYTDSIAFEKTGAITSDGVTSNFTTNADISTTTDWFGRVTEKALDIDIVSDDGNFSFDSSIALTYADTDTTASTKVTSLTSSVTNGTNTVTEQEHYEYDSVGNITGIYKFVENEKVYYNRYYYDEANQIVREDNRLGEFTSVYTYDVGGNIVSRIRYPYTEGEITGLTATEAHTYSYGNPSWGDVLTAYNGQAVTYDAMGNITSLNGEVYTWTAGRQLSRLTKADNSYIDYFYDDNGQLSMYKLYNADNTLESGAEYFWEGTRLIAVRSINSETSEAEPVFMRIIYDTDGEALGFLLNDAMPFLYTKNILGDVTGVVYYETGEYLFRYAYDAYGNYELIPCGNGTAAQILAIIYHSLNPITYRGYVFTPAIGISHYLGSRFYSPLLCRFMNADVFYNTGIGVLGTNMFAYCCNNPVSFFDPNGKFPITTVVTVAGIPTSVLVCAAGALVILVDLATGGKVMLTLTEAIGYLITYMADAITIALAASKIPSKLKNGDKLKTPDTHRDEFTRNGSKYTHKKTKWIFEKSKDGHYGGKNSHWHAYPKNGQYNDYYNVGLDGTIL